MTLDTRILDYAARGETALLLDLLEEFKRSWSSEPEAEEWHKDDLSIALCSASMHERISTVRALISYGAEISRFAPQGHLPLCCAAHGGASGVVELFIEHAINANARDRSGSPAICYAAKSLSVECVELLLLNAADPNLEDGQGKTAIEYARIKNSEEIEWMILNHIQNYAPEWMGLVSTRWASKKVLHFLYEKGNGFDSLPI